MAYSEKIRVTPNQLYQTAEEWRMEADRITAEFTRIQERLIQTAGYWQGRGGEHCRNKMGADLEAAGQVLGGLRQKPELLLRMAGIYEETERENLERGGELGSGLLE